MRKEPFSVFAATDTAFCERVEGDRSFRHRQCRLCDDHAVQSMRAVVIGEDGAARLARTAPPTAAFGELAIRTTAIGLCGSDVEKLAAPTSSTATLLGHEIVGVVESGPVTAGTRVAVLHRAPCGDCATCRAGHETCCARYLQGGLRPGGFAERLVVPEAFLPDGVVTIPDDLPDTAATLIEPLACVLRAAGTLPPGRGVVAGCGVIGLLFIRVLRGRGDLVGVLETDSARRERAEHEAGAPAPTGDADYAVVTAPAATNDALALLRPGGVMLVFAATHEPRLVDLDRLYRRELRLIGRRSATPRAFHAARDAVANGFPVADLVSDILPLDRFADGVARYRSRAALKVVFVP
jgi:L-iditol 2-dehydrogenase